MAGLLYILALGHDDAMGMVSLESHRIHTTSALGLRSPIYRNMFMAAGPYFQGRFSASPWILAHFQSAILSISTIGNFGSVLLLGRLQKGASYPKRIVASLITNMAAFTLMALSTSSTLEARGYLGLVLLMTFLTSVATGLAQNGVFSYVGGFGRGEYTQGIMTGQAIAGVLPPVARALLKLLPMIPSITS
jgi:solute carrier family 29 (equilibrative nucleoside transporter), member 1/2/3